MTLFVLFCSTMACMAAGTVEKVGGIFYNFSKWDSMDGSGNPVTIREATVTNDPSIDPWMGSSTIDTYKGDLVIPETAEYDNEVYPVVGIDDGAFRNNHGLTSLSLPKTISWIGCESIKELNNLASITVDAANENYKTIDGVLYNKAITQIYCVPTKLGGIYRIPATVTTIDNCIGRPELDELVIPATVTKLGNNFVKNDWDRHAIIKKITIEDSDNELSIGTGNYSQSFYDNGNDVWVYPLFYNCAIQEVYWGRNLKFTNKYSSPFSFSSLFKVVVGAKVTAIPEYTFIQCYNVQTVDVKGGLTQWCNFDFTGPYASPFSNYMPGMIQTLLFNGTSLSGDVVLEDAVTSIPAHAFQYGCTGITSLTLHAGVTDIADGAFRGLEQLNTISIDPANPYFIVDDNVLYDKGVTKIFCYPQQKEGDYQVPATVTALGDYQFYNCKKLTSITIPAAVMSIGTGAFSGCESLAKVIIEESNKAIDISSGCFASLSVSTVYIGRNIIHGSNAFNGSNLTTLTLGCNIDRMPAGLFAGCHDIRYIYFECDIIKWCNITFEDRYATPFGDLSVPPVLHLEGNPLHSQVNIPEGATKIGAYAFYGQNGVSRIDVPSTVTTIEPYAFNAPYVSEVIIKSSTVATLTETTSFNDKAEIYVPSTLLSDYRTADVWSTLADRIYPEGFLTVTVDLIAMENAPALLPALNALEKVDGEYRITKLTSLKIRGTMNGWDILMIRTKMPNLHTLDLQDATILDNDGGYEYYTGYHTTANTISPYCFYKLNNLRKVILPQNITSIGRYAFVECGNLSEVLYIPETCTEIEYEAFKNSGINRIEIPGSVKTIGWSAFRECYNLREVIIGEGVQTIESSAFYSCNNLSELKLGKGLLTIESEAFSNCSSLKELVLPTTLKRIGSGAFRYCYQLSDINFAQGKLTNIEYGAFEGCYNLNDLHLPTTLKRIDGNAFRYCTKLSEVHVPSMMENIGDYAFKDCGLKSVYAYTLVPIQINQNTFDYEGVKLFAPDNSFYAYYLNTQWSQFQDVFEFPADYSQWYTPRDWDIEIDLSKPIKSSGGAIGWMYPGSGMLFVGDGEQLVKELILNWQHGSNYPSLIQNGQLSVEELKFILNVYPYRWYFFCFPFDIPVPNISHDGKWVWRYYDGEERANNGSGGWKNVTDGVLRANVGYIFQCNTEGDLTLPIENPNFSAYTTGSNTQDKEVALQSYESKNAQDASWNFVGNPNLSYYGLEDLGDFNAPVTVWDNENQTYTAVMPGDDDYDFHPFEAFFVQTPTNSTEMSFDGDKRATYVQTEKKQAARAARRAARRVNENRLLMNLILSDGTTSDRTRIIFNDENKMDYEVGTDANKFMSTAAVPQIYTLDGKNVKYAINARPNGNQEVRIGYVATAEGEYTISSDLLDCYMAIKDYETGNIHMLDDGAYEFHTEKGTFDSRFALIPAGSVTGISSKGIDGFDIDAVDGAITVNGIQGQTVNIYKANGVKVASLKESGKANVSAGTYIVTVGGKSTKVLVK